MTHAVVFDSEFLTAEGSPSRFWCGPFDPDPIVAQIGLVKIDVSREFEILATSRIYVTPRDRNGERCDLDPFFTKLTSITDAQIDDHGVSLAHALTDVDAFSDGAKLWSWGKDELNMIAISCYIEGLPPPIPAGRFGNACDLLLSAGMPYEDLKKTRSNRLSAYFGIDHPPLQGHDALDDALSVSYVLQHFLRTGVLSASAFK